MPQIKEYTSRTEVKSAGPIRAATAEDFGAGVGRALVGAGEQVAEAGTRISRAQDQSEISDLNAKMSEAHAKFTVGFQESLRTADPNDKEFAAKFVQKFDEYVGNIGNEVTTPAGRAYYKTASAQMRAHFVETAAAGQSDLAGVKAKQDYSSSINNFSATLVNDPSSFELSKAMHEQSLNALVQSGLPREAALKLQTEGNAKLARSAVNGWVKLDPMIAKKQLDEGKWDQYLGGEGKLQMYGEIHQAEEGKRIEAERRKNEERKAKEEAQTHTQNDFLARMEFNKLSTTDILDSNLEAFGSGSKQQFLGLLEKSQENRIKLKTDPTTFFLLFDRIHKKDGDPNKIYNENDLNQYMGRGLSLESLNQLRAEIQGKKTTDGDIESQLKKGVMDIARGKLTRSNALTGIRDPEGDEQYQKFASQFLKEYSIKKQEGKTYDQLLNPNSPDYMGKEIEKYTRSTQQILQGMTKSISTVPTQEPVKERDPALERQPGETAAQYLERIKKQKTN